MYFSKVTASVVIFLLFAIAISHAEYTVRVIYFQPTDAPDAPMKLIQHAMEHTQEYYAEQMQEHGYGRKTFRLERDNTGEIVIHNVRGKHAANHYFNNTAGTLKAELPVKMKNENSILISFIGGLQRVAGGVTGGQGQASFKHDCGGCKGRAAVAAQNGFFRLSTVKHELGHTFGLYHNLAGKNGGNFLMWIGEDLSPYEARWLDKSRYFNDKRHIVNPPPQIFRIARPQATLKNKTDHVKFNVDLAARDGLYQAQIFRNWDHCVLDWKKLDGQRHEQVSFEVKRTDIVGETILWIHAQDQTGNQFIKDMFFVLPPKKDPLKTPIKHKHPDNLITPEKEPEPIVEEVEETKPDTKPEPEDLQVVAQHKMIVLWGVLKRY